MANKLYVGNLNYSVTDEELTAEFASAGQVVSAMVIKNKHTGRSKGFGFVEFENEDIIKAAIEAFNGKEFKGRKMFVSEARPPEPHEQMQQN